MDWLEELLGLPPDARYVKHNPASPRYFRGAQKLGYVLRNGSFLGSQPDAERSDAVCVALWAPPGHGRGKGYYCCFRVYVVDGKVQYAVMYCFYDGTDESPGFKTESSARAYARSEGFEV